MMMKHSKIGLAGCGRMGEPMLLALRDAGFDALGFDIRSPSSYGRFAQAMTDNVHQFADHVEVLITVVRDIQQTDAVLFNDQALIQAAKSLHTIVIASTLSPRYVRALRDQVPAHITLVDAPMSGAAIAAQERRLSFMLGGSKSDLKSLMPLFEAMGTSLHTMGDFGAGMTAKVLNNLLAASSTVMTRLVLDWAEQLEVDEDGLLRLIDKSSGQNWFASAFDSIEFARHGYAADNTIGILEKDVQSALDAAPYKADTSLPEILVSTLRCLKPKS